MGSFMPISDPMFCLSRSSRSDMVLRLLICSQEGSRKEDTLDNFLLTIEESWVSLMTAVKYRKFTVELIGVAVGNRQLIWSSSMD